MNEKGHTPGSAARTLLAISWILTVAHVLGELPEHETTPGAAQATEFHGDLLEWTARQVSPLHAVLSTNFLFAVGHLDRMFGDELLIDDADTSRLLLRVGLRASRFDGLSFEQRARASLSLPQARDRLMVVWDQLTEGDDLTNRDGLTAAYEETDPDLELRLRIFRPDQNILSVGGGLRFGSPVQTYGRLRASHRLLLAESATLHLAQTLRYFSEDRWVSVTEARLTCGASQGWLHRIHPSVTWREREDGCEPSITLSSFRQVGPLQAIRFDAGGTWPEVPRTRDSRYHLQVTQRWRIGRPWLFGELRLGVGFPEREGFHPAPYVGVMVEMVLGNGLP